MSLPYLAGWGDTLKQDGPELGSSIAHLVNPNVDFQTALKAAIAKNPTLLQDIANNPGLAQSLQSMGAGKQIAQQTGNLGVDPLVAANRKLAGNQATVSDATMGSTIDTANANATTAKSNANVAVGTEGARINTANTKSKFDDLVYLSAKTDFDKHAQALAVYPNPNIKAIGDAVLNGTPINPQEVSALDKDGQQVLKEYIDSANKAKERIKDMNVAQLVHHSANQQDRQMNLQLLKGLSVDLRGQLTSAQQTVRNFKPDLITKLQGQTDPGTKDPLGHQAWEDAQTQLQQYNDARAQLMQGSDLHHQLQDVDTKFRTLLGIDQAQQNAPPPRSGSGQSNGALNPSDIKQYRDNYKAGKIKKEALQAKIGAELTQQEFNQIVQ